jgi:mRNA interferase MazF
MAYTPERGDVVWISFDPQIGHEQAGRRPALIISPASYNRTLGLAVLCPITNQAKGFAFEVHIPAGLAVTGVILTDQVKNLDWRARQAVFFCKLPADTVDDARAKIRKLV